MRPLSRVFAETVVGETSESSSGTSSFSLAGEMSAIVDERPREGCVRRPLLSDQAFNSFVAGGWRSGDPSTKF